MERTRILVVGAGPVGATTAFALAERGIDTLLIDGNAELPQDMRASTLHPPTLEMMAQLGLFTDLDAQGLRAPVYQYHDRSTGEVLSFDMGELADVTPYPFRLQCEQFKLTRLIAGKLADHPHASLRMGERLLFLEQDGDGVIAHVEGPLAVKRYRADYVIAADGANSVARKLLGVPFSGFTYPERFLTLSTRYPVETHFDDLAYVSYMADAREWCVVIRVPEFWRVLVPVTGDEPDAALLSEAKKSAVYTGLLGEVGASIETDHRTIYRVHQRVAERYDHGRIILAGDAAHLNNPLGGFGMNSGIHDAVNLVDKITRILAGTDNADAMLALYDRQRRTIMNEFIQTQTVRNKQEMEAGSGSAQSRTEKLRHVVGDPALRRQYLLDQSMISARAREAAII
jgi:3-(3-hydroxy-phenyl)propionate hydroxylase